MRVVLSLVSSVAVLLLCLGRTCLGTSEYYTRTASYEGEILIKCSGLERGVVQELMEAEGVDVWHVGAGGSVDFRVSREQFQRMKGDLPECKEGESVEDIVRRAEQETRRRRQSFNQTQQEWFEEYHRYDEIVEWWRKLGEDNPTLVKYEESVGKSFEGRDQPAVHITASVEPDVKQIYFQCQIHAREWISGATCMYVANELVDRFNNGDEEVNTLLKQVEIVYMFFANPDGYEYTWTNDRLWRKNRQVPPSGSSCYGVDLNRNFNDHWAGGGSSSNPCSETYHGPSPASEPEIQNTANYFRSFGRIVGAIDWHSFSQLILRPYGWTTALPPDEAQLKELGDQMSADIFEVEGKRYTSQRAVQLYLATGGASDWFFSDDANVNNEFRAAGFTIELRDTGQYGFLLPPEQIIPNGREVFPAVLRFVQELLENPLQK